MKLEPDSCYRALLARDARFDGLFFVGVTTTGVYCRPICPARTPRKDRCEFFKTAAEAERAGHRACFRCRPEVAPGSTAAVDSVPQLVRRATARIDAGFLNEHSVDALAKELCVTSRHLRRAMEKELGVALVEIAQSRRLGLAKQLLHDTSLPLADVAHAAGFSSIRRFNALFQERFSRSPTTLRRQHGDGAAHDAMVVRLDYREPFDFDALLAFLGARAIPSIERVEAGSYQRTVVLDQTRGWLKVERSRREGSLNAQVSLSLAPKLMTVVSRLRRLFDLDARPDVIAAHLRASKRFRALALARPGLRVAGAFDPFELVVRSILGQQVSVRAATTLSGRFAERFGTPMPTQLEGLDRGFPTAGEVAGLDANEVRTIGLPLKRAHALVEVARAFCDGRVDLSPGTAPQRAIEQLEALPGIGPWTAQYVSMRALKYPDAFPAGDLAVKQALGVSSAREAEAKSAGLSPWRSYAVMHLWSSHGG